MASDRPLSQVTEHLALPADALVLTVLAGATFLLIKDLVNAPAPWIDAVDAFLVTMTLASVAGAVAAWLLHRHTAGVRGIRLAAAGLVASVAIVLLAQTAIIRTAVSSPATAAMLFTLIQVLGLVALIGLFVSGMADLLRTRAKRIDPIALVRVAALAAIAALVAFLFLPETQADPFAAQVYAVIGLATVAGPLGVGLGDVLLTFSDQRSAPCRTAGAGS